MQDHVDDVVLRRPGQQRFEDVEDGIARPVLGAKARTAGKRAKKLQELFGDRQDNVLAAQFLRRLGSAPGRNGFTFGVLYQRERAQGDGIL